MGSDIIRLRCPAARPDDAERHSAADINLPAPISAFAGVFERCACGERMVFALNAPPSRATLDAGPRDADGREVADTSSGTLHPAQREGV